MQKVINIINEEIPGLSLEQSGQGSPMERVLVRLDNGYTLSIMRDMRYPVDIDEYEVCPIGKDGNPNGKLLGFHYDNVDRACLREIPEMVKQMMRRR